MKEKSSMFKFEEDEFAKRRNAKRNIKEQRLQIKIFEQVKVLISIAKKINMMNYH